MKIKLILVFLIVLLVVGCSNVSDENYRNSMMIDDSDDSMWDNDNSYMWDDEGYNDYPMMGYGRMGYQNGMMGGLYDLTFIDEYDFEVVSEAEIEALNIAIKEEYLALALYEGYIDQVGELPPFIMIVEAEETHIAALEKLFEKYDLEIPIDEMVGEDVSSYTEACLGGVEAEIANINTYTELFDDVDNEDISEVFSLLQWGSSMHLRAFQMCS